MRDPITLVGARCTGEVELITDGEHFQRVVQGGMLQAAVSLDIATADFKAMLVPGSRAGESAGRPVRSIVQHFSALARHGVEIRLLHAGVPSGPALRELRRELPRVPSGLTIRRCPRLHAKVVLIDSAVMYLGSANLTGAGLGAKSAGRRNFELGVWTRAPALIEAVLMRFNALWEGCHCQTCQRRNVCPVPLEEPRL